MTSDEGSRATLLDAYLAAGFSVIPVGIDKRPSPILPGRQYSAYQTTRATRAEWDGWLEKNPPAIGLLAGPVSNNLVLADGDDPAFIIWMKSGELRQLFDQTWVWETACGGVQFALRSDKPVRGQDLKTPGGPKLGDVRGWGQNGQSSGYCIVPPSWISCPKHQREGAYKTLHGGPEAILTVVDAQPVLDFICEAYGRHVGATAPKAHVVVPSIPKTPDEPTALAVRAPREIPPPLQGDARDALERRIRNARLSRTIKRALLQGAVAGVGDWPREKYRDDNSRVDFVITLALLRAKFTDEEILGCFTTFHAGDFTFKNPHRKGDYGLSYLFNYTLKAAKKMYDESEIAAGQAKGDNFQVTEWVHIPYDTGTAYRLSFTTDKDQTLTCELSQRDFESDRSFLRAVWHKTQYWLKLDDMHLGPQRFGRFLEALGKLGVSEEDLPDTATEVGYHRRLIVDAITSNKPRSIEHTSDSAVGWLNGRDVYVRSEKLVTRVKGVARITVPEIWRAFASMGGRSDQVGKERIWAISKQALGIEDG